jgi:hypothetical protein
MINKLSTYIHSSEIASPVEFYPALLLLNHTLDLYLKNRDLFLSNIEEFRPEAAKILEMAAEMAAIIQPEPEKVTEDKMMSILTEILAFNKDLK